jgi:hypothetical protein
MISQTLFSPKPEQGIIETPVNVPSFDPRESAAALFNVLSEQVTPAMIKKVRVVFYKLPPRHINAGGWCTCPNCYQSATAMYNDICGCSRCGWAQGGRAKNRKAIDEI